MTVATTAETGGITVEIADIGAALPDTIARTTVITVRVQVFTLNSVVPHRATMHRGGHIAAVQRT